MPNRERRKGLDGEREVAAIFRSIKDASVQNLEGQGDLSVSHPFGFGQTGRNLHVEVKRQENARPWLWIAQAEAEALAGTIPVVALRRSGHRGRTPKWYALIGLEDLAGLLA